MKSRYAKNLVAAVGITCVGLAQSADAGVVWLASDNGSDLTLRTSGSIDMGTTYQSAENSTEFTAWVTEDSTGIYSLNGTFQISGVIGQTSGNDPWEIETRQATIQIGDSFGFHDGGMRWSGSGFPGVITPTTTMIFSGLTVDTAFGANLDAGAVLLWTHGTTGDTISIDLVPEPSSVALLSLGGLALVLRRRRQFPAHQFSKPASFTGCGFFMGHA